MFFFMGRVNMIWFMKQRKPAISYDLWLSKNLSKVMLPLGTTIISSTRRWKLYYLIFLLNHNQKAETKIFFIRLINWANGINYNGKNSRSEKDLQCGKLENRLESVNNDFNLPPKLYPYCIYLFNNKSVYLLS